MSNFEKLIESVKAEQTKPREPYYDLESFDSRRNRTLTAKIVQCEENVDYPRLILEASDGTKFRLETHRNHRLCALFCEVLEARKIKTVVGLTLRVITRFEPFPNHDWEILP